ncbi:hypothetical protein CCACVL1_10400 [Corchorus capsularis]|uniref:Uncharacterized protein n=1 Tax=Corchorus capsularis TaxID=210143 RepID=A0A1R3IRB0_COCAP|nr:hypothetical protein CCACVL1_10400 [Corchorus capsularis]
MASARWESIDSAKERDLVKLEEEETLLCEFE